MGAHSKAFPVAITILTPAIVYGVLHASLRWNLGPSCDLKEQFASPGRPAYTHRCVCLGIKYNENPPPGPGSDATRCFGWVKRSWTETDEIALKLIEEKNRNTAGRIFDQLSAADQEKVKKDYRLLQQAAFRNDYPRMLELSRSILSLVDDYGETKALEALARQAGDRGAPPNRDTPSGTL